MGEKPLSVDYLLPRSIVATGIRLVGRHTAFFGTAPPKFAALSLKVSYRQAQTVLAPSRKSITSSSRQIQLFTISEDGFVETHRFDSSVIFVAGKRGSEQFDCRRLGSLGRIIDQAF